MTSIWKRLHKMHKENSVDEEDEFRDGFYIIPCDECKHFGCCKYEKQCNEDVHTGRALEHFKEKK